MKKIGRPPKHMQKQRMPQFESVIRTGGRLKKIKKVFDPSENNTPRKRHRSPSASNSTDRLTNSHEEGEGSDNVFSKPAKKTYSKTSEVKKTSPKTESIVEDYCLICSRQEWKKSTTLIHCKDCNLKAHQICMKTNFKNAQLLQKEWRCDSCKTCSICYETAEIGALITCSLCIQSYHHMCHVPKVILKSINKFDWTCFKCSSEPKQYKAPLSKRRISSPPTATVTQNDVQSSVEQPPPLPPPPTISQPKILRKKTKLHTLTNTKCATEASDTVQLKKEVEENETQENGVIAKRFDESVEVPDVSGWSCEKMASFIEECFPKEAVVVRDQEIDGASLLLMTRSDVLTGLGLKLGPAIRLYNFIVGLQSKKFDTYATWM